MDELDVNTFLKDDEEFDVDAFLRDEPGSPTASPAAGMDLSVQVPEQGVTPPVQEGQPAKFSKETVQHLAAKYGVPVEDLEKQAVRFGAVYEDVDLPTYLYAKAYRAGDTMLGNIPSKIAQAAQEPKTRQAIDELRETVRKGQSVGQDVADFAAGMTTPLAKHLGVAKTGAVFGAGNAPSGEEIQGGAIGGVLGKIGEGVGNKVGQALQSGANRLSIRASRPMLSQQAKLGQKGIADDLGQELLETGVTTRPTMQGKADRLAEVLKEKGARIGEIRSKADQTMGPEDLIRLQKLLDVAKQRKAAAQDQLSAVERSANVYGREAARLAKTPNRSIAEVQDIINRQIDPQIDNFARGAGDDLTTAGALKDLRRDLVSQVDDRVQQFAPDDAVEYGELKRKFSMLKDGEDILERAAARAGTNNMISLRGALMGTNMGETLAEKGLAAAAITAGERGAASVGAGTLNLLAKTLQTNPSKLGKFAGPLQKAANQSNATLGMIHHILMRNPEYVDLLEQMRQAEPAPSPGAKVPPEFIKDGEDEDEDRPAIMPIATGYGA